jgi:hypothetical protein
MVGDEVITKIDLKIRFFFFLNPLRLEFSIMVCYVIMIENYVLNHKREWAFGTKFRICSVR